MERSGSPIPAFKQRVTLAHQKRVCFGQFPSCLDFSEVPGTSAAAAASPPDLLRVPHRGMWAAVVCSHLSWGSGRLGQGPHSTRTTAGQTGGSSQNAIPTSVQLSLKLSLLFTS